ncbi:helix-turn-helix domain-containing protein [Bacillus mycoides]|uniref:helix-turn-helix domain-containing protein n=1 Tax=Bacillus mycoides TaxID=1405 RepID=UPI001C035DB3|nr:helix-turn-helix domain-containing protein [Bacillus mycoides]QWI47064.1 DNA-binding protein [Bacillus mycoides]
MGYKTFEEICKEANLSKNQLRYLIKHKKIEPINRDTWKGDGGFRFEDDKAQLIIDEYKGYLSLKDAAAYLQKSRTYVHNIAKQGSLPFKEVVKGKTTEKLYHLKDLEEFKRKMNDVDMVNKRMNDHIQLYSNDLLLFDKIEFNGQEVRVLDVDKRIGINSHNENLMIPEKVASKQFNDETIQKKKITKPGDVSFLLPLYTAYDVILYVISHLGVSNVLVSKKNEGYFMKCKLGSIPFDTHIFRVLNTCLISGHMQQKKDRIHFTNNKEHVSLYLDPNIIKNAKQKANEKGYKGYKKVLEEILDEKLRD